MAATIERFYVYRLFDGAGVTQYIGKGCDRRLANQRRRFRLNGEIISRFAKEGAAYDAEVRLIAEIRPPLNKHRGGNGSKAKRAKRRAPWEIEMARIGARAYSARL